MRYTTQSDMPSVSILSLLGLVFGENPNWPPTDLGLSAINLADIRIQPDDPEYAPWQSSTSCEGQFAFYSYAPNCMSAGLRDLAHAPGVGVDGAWLYSIGHPQVSIAIIGEGFRLTHPDIAFKIRLNPTEISARPGTSLDTNRDGVITVHDFTSASKNERPTLDTITDPRLTSRADRGDVNANQYLDPEDLLAVFADEADNDGNGLVDDIISWNFLTHNPVPHPAASPSRDLLTARAAAAQTNDGVGMAGACPLCTLLPIRVANRGLSSADNLGLALLYAAYRGASVAVVDVAIPGRTPFLDRVLTAIQDRMTVVYFAGHSKYHSATTALPPAFGPASVLVASRGFNTAPNSASSATSPLDCAVIPTLDHVAVPGNQCNQMLAAGIMGGVLGLMTSVQMTQGQVDPVRLAGLVQNLTQPLDPALSGYPLRSVPDTFGPPLSPQAGRLDARRAVQAAVDQARIYPGFWTSPQSQAVIDPIEQTLTINAEIPNLPLDTTLSWRVSLGQGLEPTRFLSIDTGELTANESGRLTTQVQLNGLLSDPALVPQSLSNKMFWLRLETFTGSDSPRVLSATTYQPIFIDADLDRLPGFPVDLGYGAVGGPRFIDADQDGTPELWIALVSGQVVRVEAGNPARMHTWAALKPATDLPISNWIPNEDDDLASARSVAHLSSPAFTGSEVGVVSANGILRLFRNEAATKSIGLPIPPTAQYPAGWISPAFGLGPTFPDQKLFWLRPDGVYDQSQQLIYALNQPGQGIAVQLDQRESVFWAINRNRLVNNQNVDTALPSERPALSGLNQLRLHAPIMAGEQTDEQYPVVPTLTWASLQTEPLTDEPLPNSQYCVGPLSTQQEQVICWATGPDDPHPHPISLQTDPNLPRLETFDPILHEVLVTDVDGSTPEWVFAGDPSRLWAISENRAQAVGWPKLTGQPIWGTPSVGDLDGDGLMEIAAVTRGGHLYVWRTRGTEDKVFWAGDRHDLAATGNGTSDVTGLSISDDGCQCVRSNNAPSSPFVAGFAVMSLLGMLWFRRRNQPAT